MFKLAIHDVLLDTMCLLNFYHPLFVILITYFFPLKLVTIGMLMFCKRQILMKWVWLDDINGNGGRKRFVPLKLIYWCEL